MLRPHFLGISAACTSLSFLVQSAPPVNWVPEQRQPLNRAAFAHQAITAARKSFFVLPVDSKPRRSQGSATRCSNLGELLPRPLIPSEEVAGQTVSSHPSLFLYLPESVPVPIQFSVSQPASGGPPIYETRIEAPKAGILKIELPADRPALSGNEVYLWSVTVLESERRPAVNPLYVSWIERVPMKPELEAALAAATTERDRARAYAQAGAWYDALATLYEAQQENPDDPDLQADWNTLLNEVGLTEVTQKCGYHPRSAAMSNLSSSLLQRRKFSRASPVGVHHRIAAMTTIHRKPSP
jgi:hypothetical protein